LVFAEFGEKIENQPKFRKSKMQIIFEFPEAHCCPPSVGPNLYVCRQPANDDLSLVVAEVRR